MRPVEGVDRGWTWLGPWRLYRGRWERQKFYWSGQWEGGTFYGGSWTGHIYGPAAPSPTGRTPSSQGSGGDA